MSKNIIMTKYITPPKVFAHLQPSLFADSIYYADLFRFNDAIWMITGRGKSKAARIIIDKNDTNDLGRDAVAIKSENDTIFGRYDSGAINPNQEDLNKFYQINYIAHCLTENQSNTLKNDLGASKLSITEVDNMLVARMLSAYPYPAPSIKHFFSEEECIRLWHPERRYNRFLEITDNCVNTKFVLVPWANTLEEKALLYKEFLKLNEN
jgi:hypothetical protein